VGSERCERVQIANNMILVVMVIRQLNVMRQMHKTKFKDKGQVGRPTLHLISSYYPFGGPKGHSGEE
jgi:hypothetical protein